MKTTAFVLCIAALASCAPQASDTPPVDFGGQIASAASDLSGHYRITSLGEGLLPFPIEVSADADSIWWEPSCAAQGLFYRPAADGKIEFFDPRDPDEPQIICDIGYPEELKVVWERLKGTHDVQLRADRSMLVEVDGQPWLFEPTTDPLPPDLTGTWQIERINGLSTVEMRMVQLKADGQELWWEPRCARVIVEYSMEGETFSVVEPADMPPPASKEGEAPTPPKPVCTIGLPRYLTDAMDAIRNADNVTRDYENNIALSGEGSRIALSTAEE